MTRIEETDPLFVACRHWKPSCVGTGARRSESPFVLCDGRSQPTLYSANDAGDIPHHSCTFETPSSCDASPPSSSWTGVALRIVWWKQRRQIAAGLIAIGVPVVFGQVHATPSRAESYAQGTGDKAPVYDVVSFKPNKSGSDWETVRLHRGGFTATNITTEAVSKKVVPS